MHPIVRRRREEENEEESEMPVSYHQQALVHHHQPTGIPESVSDQLQLWEMELNRFSATPAVLVELPTHLSAHQIQGFTEKVKGLGGCLWDGKATIDGRPVPVVVMTEKASESMFNTA